MKTFGMNATLVESMKNIAPTRLFAYYFDSAMPANIQAIPFDKTAAGLIENCNNAGMLNQYFTTNQSVNLTSVSNLIKSGDLVAQYRGEAVVFKDGVTTATSFPDHLVYYPKSITCKGDYRDHNTFNSFMYKTAGDYGFDGLDTFIARTTENDEAIVFEYHTPRTVNCFGIKQSLTLLQTLFQFHIEFWTGSAWTLIETSPQNQLGYWLVKFAEVTATRFRIRKISTTGTAANADIAFAYFGKIGFVGGDVRKNVAKPRWALLVPEHIAAATLTNLQLRQNDTYSSRFLNTEHMIMVSAGDLSESTFLRMNFHSTDEYSKYEYNMVLGQIL